MVGWQAGDRREGIVWNEEASGRRIDGKTTVLLSTSLNTKHARRLFVSFSTAVDLIACAHSHVVVLLRSFTSLSVGRTLITRHHHPHADKLRDSKKKTHTHNDTNTHTLRLGQEQYIYTIYYLLLMEQLIHARARWSFYFLRVSYFCVHRAKL